MNIYLQYSRDDNIFLDIMLAHKFKLLLLIERELTDERGFTTVLLLRYEKVEISPPTLLFTLAIMHEL